MKNKIIIVLFVITFINHNKTTAQISSRNIENEWLIGFGLNTIIDSGESVSDLFNFSESYHFSFPFKLSVEKKIAINHGIEIRATSNRFKKSKKFNGEILTNKIDFFSVDASYKYYILDKKNSHRHRKIFSYISTGLGSSWYNSTNDRHFHIGGGINYKVRDNILLNFQTIGKLSIANGITNNYIQIDFGVIIPLSFYL